MKKFYTFMLTLALGISSFGQVSVGTQDYSYSGNGDSGNGPVNCFFGYSYYQLIYKASDINASGPITSIQFEMINDHPIENSDDDLDVWIGHTSKDKFENTNDWIDINTLSKVVNNGSLTKTGTTVTINFETPFEYNGTDNLVIAIDANEMGYDTNSDRFYSSQDVNQNKINLYSRHDNYNPDPSNPTAMFQYNLTTSYYPNIIFNGITQACPKPTDLTANNITGTSADLSWTQNGSVNNWTIEYGISGFTPGNGTVINANSNPFSLTGLTPSSQYEYYVKANCDSENSFYAGPFAFSTACDTVTPEYTANMAVYPPYCWNSADGTMGGTLEFGDSEWRDNRAITNENNEIVNCNTVNLYKNSIRTWLITNSFDLSAGNYSLETLVALTNYSFDGTSNSYDTASMGSDDKVYLLISTDNGTTWTDIKTWDATNQPAVTGTKEVFDLSSYTGVVKFAFYATDGDISDSEDYDFHVGGFKISSDNLAVDDVENNNVKYQFYPNPVNDILVIKGEQKIGEVSIYDLSGKLVYKNIYDRNTATINMSGMDAGQYIINAEIDGKMQNFKILKK